MYAKKINTVQEEGGKECVWCGITVVGSENSLKQNEEE